MTITRFDTFSKFTFGFPFITKFGGNVLSSILVFIITAPHIHLHTKSITNRRQQGGVPLRPLLLFL